MSEFIRDASDQRRVLIIDIAHVFYRYAYGGVPNLTGVLQVNGQSTIVNSTLPNFSIKAIHRWANKGFNPVVVCFDSAGSNNARKAYFAQYGQEGSGAQVASGYKEGRGFAGDSFYQGVNITSNMLLRAGVTVLKADGFEADDLIKIAVDRAKKDYPNLPIDIITGDQDLIPLVDDQVSVFISSRRTTFAEDKSIEKVNYFQLRPYNFQQYLETLSEFKTLSMPYNTALLKKLLRGKKADNIPQYPKFTPTKFNKLVAALQEDGHDLGKLFRYGNYKEQICYRGTGDPIPIELIDSVPKEQKMRKFLEPDELTQMLSVLSDYLDEDTVNHVRYVYNGICLNAPFTNVPERFKRAPVAMKSGITGYDASVLAQVASELQINISVV